MSTDDVMLFIDANTYLDLYRTVAGKQLLEPLSEQIGNIFVTRQVANEVNRNKIKVSAEFLARQFTKIELQAYNVPDHLFGLSEIGTKNIQGRMKEIRNQIKQVNKDLNDLAKEIMEKISRSDDEVSSVLIPLFAKAQIQTPAELLRARQRKERGEPPGKNTDPLGDQVTWEQLLSRVRNLTTVLIVTRDSDYGTMFEGRSFLNQSLYDDLRRVSPGVKAHLFRDIASGIRHFADTTGVKASGLPTEKEVAKINEEIDALPPLDSISDDNGSKVIGHRDILATALGAAGVIGGAPTLGYTLAEIVKSFPTKKG